MHQQNNAPRAPAPSASKERHWHGWSSAGGGAALHVGYLPGRKSCCLYTIDGSVLDVLAYFRSEDHAAACLRMLDLLAGI